MKKTILLFCGAVIIAFAGAKSCWGDDRIKIDNTSPAAMYNAWARNRNFINEQSAKRNGTQPVIHQYMPAHEQKYSGGQSSKRPVMRFPTQK